MEKVLEAIKDYDKLKCNLELLKFSPLNEYQKEVLKVFNYFDIDMIKIESTSNGSNILIDELIKLKDIINIITSKYNIHSIQEFENRIVELWDTHHFFDIELLRIVLGWVDENNPLGKIYIDMVKENLISNPNVAVGVSSEPIFTLLPKYEKFVDYNLIVLSDTKVDWNLLKNGTPVLESLVYDYNHEINTVMKKYYHDVIMNGIKSAMCLFNNTYYHSRNSWKTKRDIGLCYLSLFPTTSCSIVLEDPEFINEVKEYLLCDGGLEQQVSLYSDINDDGDKAIIYLSNLIKEKNNKQKLLTNKELWKF